MATYRCLQSGNTVTFTLQHDIDSMKGHAGYVRIDEDAPAEPEFDPNKQRDDTPLAPPARPRGRPRKAMTL